VPCDTADCLSQLSEGLEPDFLSHSLSHRTERFTRFQTPGFRGQTNSHAVRCASQPRSKLCSVKENKTHGQVMEADRQGCAGNMLSVSHQDTCGGYQAGELFGALKGSCCGAWPSGASAQNQPQKADRRAASASDQQRAPQTPLPPKRGRAPHLRYKDSDFKSLSMWAS